MYENEEIGEIYEKKKENNMNLTVKVGQNVSFTFFL